MAAQTFLLETVSLLCSRMPYHLKCSLIWNQLTPHIPYISAKTNSLLSCPYMISINVVSSTCKNLPSLSYPFQLSTDKSNLPQASTQILPPPWGLYNCPYSNIILALLIFIHFILENLLLHKTYKNPNVLHLFWETVTSSPANGVLMQAKSLLYKP